MEENIIRIENAALKLGNFSIKPAIINIVIITSYNLWLMFRREFEDE